MTFAKMSVYDSIAKTVLFGPKKRKRSLSKLATYVEENIQIVEALRQMATFASHDGQKPNDFTARVYKKWAARISAGNDPSAAMLGYIPELERQVIVAADKYGRLGQGIREALEIREGIDRIRSAMRVALLYPAILLVAVTSYFIFMAGYIMPAWHEALPLDRWPSSAARLELVSGFVYQNFYIIYPGLAAALALVFYSMPRWTGRARSIIDDIIPYSIYRTIYGTIFLLSLSGYVRAGMNVPLILETMLRTAQPWYAERLRAILKQVRNGKNLGDALEHIGYQFPDREVVEDLRVFTRHRGFDETLKTMGREILNESVEKISGQSIVIRNIAIAIMGGLMFWFTNALFDYQSAVATSAGMVR